nr:hypothetical protein Itr_chr10CG06230 [Ipomoea trifida]GMD43352.1 hypothetical protein Iba_chr10cCG4450 [Ipomoea batatas]GME08872.1 hypothetical protein Iba_scaffold8000.4CG1490 [Ipomoea batatas]
MNAHHLYFINPSSNSSYQQLQLPSGDNWAAIDSSDQEEEKEGMKNRAKDLVRALKIRSWMLIGFCKRAWYKLRYRLNF